MKDSTVGLLPRKKVPGDVHVGSQSGCSWEPVLSGSKGSRPTWRESPAVRPQLMPWGAWFSLQSGPELRHEGPALTSCWMWASLEGGTYP